MKRLGFVLGLLILIALHQDLWAWHDASLVLGLPVGLTYHVFYCLAAALFFAAMVKWDWPFDDSAEDEA